MKNIFDRYYKKYDAWYARNRSAYLSELAALKKALPKRGRGLEIGVGTGRFAAALDIKYGIDPARNMIRIARQRGIAARRGKGEKLLFRNASFDYIAIIITLCFVKDPEKILKEAKRVLNKKGKIIIGIIDKNSFLGKFYQKKKSIFYQQAQFFSVQEVKDLLKAAGFGKFSFYQTVFNFPGKLHIIEKPKKGFGQGGFVVIGAKKT